MLLIDGVRYELWTPPSEDDFERVVVEHAQDIFGEDCIYFDRKQRLKSLSGIGSIPDGYAIIPGGKPEWHVVEVELSSHPLHEHIVSQVSRFISGIGSPSTQKKIADAMDSEIRKQDTNLGRLRKAIEPTEVYRFLSNLVSQPPILTIIIEDRTAGLQEAVNTLAHPEIKTIEFQTFVRQGVGLGVHAHLFEPLYPPAVPAPHPVQPDGEPETMEIKVWATYLTHEYIGIWEKHRNLFPPPGTTVELVADNGESFDAHVGKAATGSTELWNLRGWFKANPSLKEGDFILITPIEPMKKYRLQIGRQEP